VAGPTAQGSRITEKTRPSLAKQESSVRHLQQLYTIVAGLALSDAVGQLFRGDAGGWNETTGLLLLAAFVVTLIPFYHGAMRHLDDVYLIDAAADRVRRVALAVDFAFLFAESCVLFAMAHQLANPPRFFLFLVLLLVVDVAWLVGGYVAAQPSHRLAMELQLLFRPRRGQAIAPLVWTKNNLFFIALAIVASLILRLWPGLDEAPSAALLTLFALARTANDYRLSWDFYFPSPQSEGEEEPWLATGPTETGQRTKRVGVP
jgi:hypothetical protein